MAQRLMAEIGGVDYGPGGQNLLLQPFRLTTSGPGRIGGGHLSLKGRPGLDAAILNQMLVKLWLKDTATNTALQRYFIGFVSRLATGQLPGTTQKTWEIDLQDANLELQSLASKAAWAQRVHLAAGKFPDQVAALFVAVNTGGLTTLSFDASTYVADVANAATLPAADFTGLTLSDMLGALYASARKGNPLCRPVGTLIPNPTVPGGAGLGFDAPVVYIFDSAVTPVLLGIKKYNNTGGDGSHYAILPDQPFSRSRESPRLVNWRQSVTPDGTVYTGSDPVSITTYPNPCDPDAAWKGPALRDTQNQRVGANATGTATVGGGAVTGVTVGLGGVYVSPPGVRFVGGGGSGALARANLSGSAVVSVTIVASGTGYSSAPTVVFDDPVQVALNNQVFATSNPRETLTILTKEPALPGTYVAVTLSLEAGLTDYIYLVNALTADFSIPNRPQYTLELGARRLRLGEQDGDDVFGPPLEGVRLGPPTNFAQANHFLPYQGNTEVDYTWTPPVPPPGMQIDHYILHTHTGGQEFQDRVAGNVATVATFVNPGQIIDWAYLVAFDQHGAPSFPTPNIGPFTPADFYRPDAPTSLTVTRSGPEAHGKGWAEIDFIVPGTSHGPNDYYQALVSGGGVTWPLQRFDGGQTPGTHTRLIISGFTRGVSYSVQLRTVSNPLWPGASYSSPVTVLISGFQPLPSTGFSAGERPFDGYTPSDATRITLDPATAYKTVGSARFAPAGGTTLTLTGDAVNVVAGQVLACRLAYKKDANVVTPGLAIDWYDGLNGTGSLLSTTTVTLAAATTSWQSKEVQVTAPASAQSGVARLTAGNIVGTPGVLWFAVLMLLAVVMGMANYEPGSISDPAIATAGLTDVTKTAWDIQTNPFKFYDGGSAHYRGTLAYDAGLDEIVLLAINPTSGNTKFQIGANNSTLTFDPNVGAKWTGAENVLLQTFSTNQTLSAHQRVAVDASGGARTMTLPAASAASGRTYFIKKIDTSANSVTVAAGGGDTIEGATSLILKTQWAWIELTSDGVNTWLVFGQ